jgi:hypothetical protein
MGSCESHYPQSIPIRRELHTVKEKRPEGRMIFRIL